MHQWRATSVSEGFVSAPLHYIDWNCQIIRNKFKDHFYLTPLINPQLFLFNNKSAENTSLKSRAAITSLWQHIGGKGCPVLAQIHLSFQTRFLYLQNLHGGTQLHTRIIFYFQVAKLSPNKLHYFTAIYSTYQAASNFNPKSSSPFILPKLTPTAFRKSISDRETLMKQTPWIKKRLRYSLH